MKETTKARTTLCSSLPLLRLSPLGDLASNVESASAAYLGITVAPHEYFDQTRFKNSSPSPPGPRPSTSPTKRPCWIDLTSAAPAFAGAPRRFLSQFPIC